MTHGRHIYETSSGMITAKMCTYPPYQHFLPHCKHVLRYYDHLPRIDIPGQESYRHQYNKYPTMQFHVYNLIVRCTAHGRRPPEEK